MSIVISDASCLILFTNIDRLDILNSLFGHIWVTSEVEREYKLEIPDFVSVRNPVNLDRLATLQRILDPGEASAITLAAEIPDSKIIIDEKKGRRVAITMGLNVTGSVGVILEAIQKGLIEADDKLVEELDQEGFRLSARLKSLILRSD